MPRRSRTIATAIGLSLAAHLGLGLLLARGAPELVARPQRTIETVLFEVAKPKPRDPPKPIAAAPTVPLRPAARAPVRASAPRAAAGLAHDVEPVEPLALTPAGTLDVSAGLPAGGAGDASEAAAATAGAPGGEGAGVGSHAPGASDVKAQIQALLAGRAAQCYPAPAARLGLTGVAEVHFCVGPRGEATEVRVEHGSGESLLDRAASGCVVEGAAPLPAYAGCLVVPVEFQRRR